MIDPQDTEPQKHATSDALEGVVKNHAADAVQFGELMAAMHERGFAFLMLLFVLPNCVPVPVPPGISTILSIPLIFLAAQMIWGHGTPWLPAWLRRKAIQRSTLALIVEKVSPRLRRVEKILRRRFFYHDPDVMERLVGMIGLLFAISIAVPLPMTNFLPGVGILLMSLGLLSHDGVFIGIGALVGFAGTAFTIAILILGKKAVISTLGLAGTGII